MPDSYFESDGLLDDLSLEGFCSSYCIASISGRHLATIT